MTHPLPSGNLDGAITLFGNERHVLVLTGAPVTTLPLLTALARTKATVHVLGEQPLAHALASVLDDVPVFVVRDSREARQVVADWQADKYGPLELALNCEDVAFAYGVAHAS